MDPVGKSVTERIKTIMGKFFQLGGEKLNGKVDKTVAAIRKVAAHCVYSRGTQADTFLMLDNSSMCLGVRALRDNRRRYDLCNHIRRH